MKFEVSEKIRTTANKSELITVLEELFKKVSHSVSINGDCLYVKSIEASFDSIFRNDTTIIKINNIDDGYLLIADVCYRPSVAFWIIFIITLFTYVFWMIPIIFYIIQKNTVREGIQDVFNRIKNQFDNITTAGTINNSGKTSTTSFDLDQLEKLAYLKEKGIITEEEFQLKKKEILNK